MAINVEGAVHVELNLVGKDKQAQTILPYNTADDVIVDDQTNVLSDVLPMVKTEEDKMVGSLMVKQEEEVDITNPALIALLTSTEDEDEEEDEG